MKNKKNKPSLFKPRSSQASWSKTKPPPIYYKCGKMRHFSNNCKTKEKINNLKIDESNLLKSIKTQLKILLLESGSGSKSSQNLENDTESSRSDQESKKKNYVITKEQHLLLKFIDKIEDPEQRKEYLSKLKETISGESFTKNIKPTYNLNNILKRFEPEKKKYLSIQDHQIEINLLKIEINQIKWPKYMLTISSFVLKLTNYHIYMASCGFGLVLRKRETNQNKS